ncbi:hypothetical protein F5Y01DRAFT_68538 [Xylaria sp. FL0043]|nr:hypothetical protein F5Y01DRAFT_68538 [Xylaria sp. FL0043]
MSPVAENTSYAPRSPDLSSLYSGQEFHSTYYKPNAAFPNSTSGGHHSLQPLAQPQVRPQVRAPVQQLEPGSQNFNQPQSHHQYQAHPYNNNHNRSGSIGNGSARTTDITNRDAYHLPPHQHAPIAPYADNRPQHSGPPYHHQYYQPPTPQQQQYPPPHHPSHHPPYYYTDSPTSTGYLPAGQNTPQQQHLHVQHLHQQHQLQLQQQEPSHLAFDGPTTSSPPNAMPRGKAAAQVAREPEVMDSPVRTKFPTARIKRIMQADEEVGKVAQQTPIAVGKALELFMVQLVHKSAEVAKEKNSKRITAPMLKVAIDSTTEWDFLREIVAKVTEEKEGAKSSGRPKAESDSDDDGDTGEVKKRGRGGRKRKATT